MAYYVYVLRSEKDGSFYIGHTADLDERIQRHNRGRSSYTKTKLPWKLIYQEEFLSRSEAMKQEREIKRKKNRTYIDYLVRASRARFGEVVPT
jgi:putative endonuclease